MEGKISQLFLMAALTGILLSTFRLHGQIPTTLTDKIYQGSGTINLLQDVSAAHLQQYLNSNGGLLLGIDLNENAAGNESSDSVGIAIKQMNLVVTTTAGTFSFGDFFTSTTAIIREAGGAVAQKFYTAFGKSGSSAITGGTTGYDLGGFDDVIRIDNVALQGTLLKARLDVTFLDTAKSTTQNNETFFDFSGGFEDFALLGRKDAALLEAANFGVSGAPSGIAYTATAPTVTLPTPGAPAPPLGLLLAMGALVVWKSRRSACHGRS